MKSSEFKISISVKSFDEKTGENYRNCYVPENRIVLTQRLIAQIEDLNKDCVKIPCPYLLYFWRNKPLKSVTVRRVGPVHHFK